MCKSSQRWLFNNNFPKLKSFLESIDKELPSEVTYITENVCELVTRFKDYSLGSNPENSWIGNPFEYGAVQIRKTIRERARGTSSHYL